MTSSPIISGSATATDAVLNTTELLENILSFLPMQQLPGKVRVSRKWKSVVDGSPTLQHKLWLPRSDGKAGVISPDHLFTDIGHPAGLTTAEFVMLSSLRYTPVYTSPVELNPLASWGNQGSLHLTHEMNIHTPFALYGSILKVVFGRYNRVLRYRFGGSSQTPQTESSWRKMFLTSPPVTDVMVRIPRAVGQHSVLGPVRAKCYAEHGVTLGLLCDTVENQLQCISIADARHWVERGPDLTEKKFAGAWGKKEYAMFLVKDVAGTAND